MIDRLLEDLEWPGRRVRGDSDSVETKSKDDDPPAQEDQSTPSLIKRGRGPRIREKLDQARDELDKLEQEASRQLDEVLDMPTDGLAQVQESVAYMTGQHPDFGTRFPEPDEIEKIDTGGQVTGEVFRRSYDTMERADINAYGVDFEEAVFEDGEVRPYDPIQSPHQATGRREVGRGKPTSLPKAFSQSSKDRKMSIWSMLAKAVGGFLLKIPANVIRAVGDAAANALSISVAGKTIGIGKFIAKPFYWLADKLDELAEKLLQQALGHEPDAEAEDSPHVPLDEESDGYPTNRPSRLEDAADEALQAHPDAAGPKGVGGGNEFLMASQNIMEATATEAVRRDDPKLSRAISLYDKARTLKRDLEAQESIATAWGVPESDEAADTARDARSQPQTQPQTATAEETQPFDEC